MYGDRTNAMDLEEFIHDFHYLFKGGYALYFQSDEDDAPDPSTFESLEDFSMWRGSYAEEDVCALLRLKDGRYAALDASCDSTGYDCIGHVTWTYHSSYDEAVKRGLTKYNREALFGKDEYIV